ncbi:MAG: glycogen-debranching protein [Chlamydiae bacterium]|nr:glycogen-debranching protein [Chlamydiota bacterium]
MTKALPTVLEGTPYPLGCSSSSLGTNVAFYSTAKEVFFLLILSDREPLSLALNPSIHKTDSIWHLFLYEVSPPFSYAILIDGQILLDPYALSFSSSRTWGQEDPLPLISHHIALPSFDWEDTEKSSVPFHEWIIYEAHLRAFTADSKSHVQNPGTFLGFIEKIPYLVSLGINAVELLPIFAFNECENRKINPVSPQTPLFNFWGYSTQNFFAPMPKYTVGEQWTDPITECKTLIRELHRHGIAVILDVVYNHTGEGDEQGPCYAYKKLAKESYYLVDKKGKLQNFSGTGNTMNCNHPISTQLIVDSLTFWAEEMRVDAFRFDLAAILTRDTKGNPTSSPPLLEKIKQCPALQNTPLIAEAWDAAGLYQVGSFPGKERWSEWNGWYRDTVRRFLRGVSGEAGNFAKVLCGSQDLYWQHTPTRSINFVTCHDGFTLHDLVTYENKHNLENGENNRDGESYNNNWNCGIEGETTDQDVLFLRLRQQKNFLVALLVSLGVPMILMGDEYNHTKNGNNNTYCHDDSRNWFLWDECKKNKEFFSFFQQMIAFRKEKKALFCKTSFLKDHEVTWHGKKPFTPDWTPSSHYVVYTLQDPQDSDCLIAFNASSSPLLLTLPPPKDQTSWYRIVDTSLLSPDDFTRKKNQLTRQGTSYLLHPFTSIILETS